MSRYGGLIARASGIIDGENPAFSVSDFRKMMPSFTEEIVDDTIVQMYIDNANAVVKEARWHQLWKEGMRLYVAHFLTLYIQTQSDPESGKYGLLNAAGVNGVATSKSIKDVSISYDINVANGDLTGWAAWKLTTYGTQYATLAKMLTKGGMYIR